MGVGAADPPVERHSGLGGGRLGRRERHPENRVGSQAGLVLRAVEGNQSSVDRALIGGVEAQSAPGRSPRERCGPRARRLCRDTTSGSPSRSSTASCLPVDAPDGTAARPTSPELSSTSTSTVGLPRESRICRPRTAAISVLTAPPWRGRSSDLASRARGRRSALPPGPQAVPLARRARRSDRSRGGAPARGRRSGAERR